MGLNIIATCVVCGDEFESNVYNIHHAKYCNKHRYISKLKRSHSSRAAGNFTPEEWYCLVRDAGFRCANCGTPGDCVTLHADHILPVAKGGTNHVSNIQPLCGKCNMAKGAKLNWAG